MEGVSSTIDSEWGRGRHSQRTAYKIKGKQYFPNFRAGTRPKERPKNQSKENCQQQADAVNEAAGGRAREIERKRKPAVLQNGKECEGDGGVYSKAQTWQRLRLRLRMQRSDDDVDAAGSCAMFAASLPFVCC